MPSLGRNLTCVLHFVVFGTTFISVFLFAFSVNCYRSDSCTKRTGHKELLTAIIVTGVLAVACGSLYRYLDERETQYRLDNRIPV